MWERGEDWHKGLWVSSLWLLLACTPFARGSRAKAYYPVETVTIKVTHRLYPDFEETHTVRLKEKFQISDTEYYAQAILFVPDFAINEKGEVLSRSGEPKNPAVRIIVFVGKKKIDELWAFTGTRLPHFKKTSLLAFELLAFTPKARSGEEK